MTEAKLKSKAQLAAALLMLVLLSAEVEVVRGRGEVETVSSNGGRETANHDGPERHILQGSGSAAGNGTSGSGSAAGNGASGSVAGNGAAGSGSVARNGASGSVAGNGASGSLAGNGASASTNPSGSGSIGTGGSGSSPIGSGLQGSLPDFSSLSSDGCDLLAAAACSVQLGDLDMSTATTACGYIVAVNNECIVSTGCCGNDELRSGLDGLRSTVSGEFDCAAEGLDIRPENECGAQGSGMSSSHGSSLPPSGSGAGSGSGAMSCVHRMEDCMGEVEAESCDEVADLYDEAQACAVLTGCCHEWDLVVADWEARAGGALDTCDFGAACDPALHGCSPQEVAALSEFESCMSGTVLDDDVTCTHIAACLSPCACSIPNLLETVAAVSNVTCDLRSYICDGDEPDICPAVVSSCAAINLRGVEHHAVPRLAGTHAGPQRALLQSDDEIYNALLSNATIIVEPYCDAFVDTSAYLSCLASLQIGSGAGSALGSGALTLGCDFWLGSFRCLPSCVCNNTQFVAELTSAGSLCNASLLELVCGNSTTNISAAAPTGSGIGSASPGSAAPNSASATGSGTLGSATPNSTSATGSGSPGSPTVSGPLGSATPNSASATGSGSPSSAAPNSGPAGSASAAASASPSGSGGGSASSGSTRAPPSGAGSAQSSSPSGSLASMSSPSMSGSGSGMMMLSSSSFPASLPASSSSGHGSALGSGSFGLEHCDLLLLCVQTAANEEADTCLCDHDLSITDHGYPECQPVFDQYCEGCPAHAAFEPMGSMSGMAGGCQCLPGFGIDVNASMMSDEMVCAACPPGTSKDTSGNHPCQPCPLGTFSPLANSSTCIPCPPFSSTAMPGASDLSECLCDAGYRPDESGECVEAAGSFCARAAVPVDASCSVPPINVSCIFPTQEDFEDFLGAGPLPIAAITPDCIGFYQWLCGSLNVPPRPSLQCDTACRYADLVVRSAFETEECVSEALCGAGYEAAQSAMCKRELEYAIWSSCDFTASPDESYADRVADLLDLYPKEDDTCYLWQGDTSIVSLISLPPPSMASLLQVEDVCLESTPCEFACMLSNFSLSRVHDLVSIRFDAYRGECDCPTISYGTMLYDETEPVSDTKSPVAARIEGTHLGMPLEATFHAILKEDALFVDVALGSTRCSFPYRVTRGSFLGLPSPVAAETSPVSAIEFQGLDEELSSPNLLADILILLGLDPSLGAEAIFDLRRRSTARHTPHASTSKMLSRGGEHDGRAPHRSLLQSDLLLNYIADPYCDMVSDVLAYSQCVIAAAASFTDPCDVALAEYNCLPACVCDNPSYVNDADGQLPANASGICDPSPFVAKCGSSQSGSPMSSPSPTGSSLPGAPTPSGSGMPSLPNAPSPSGSGMSPTSLPITPPFGSGMQSSVPTFSMPFSGPVHTSMPYSIPFFTPPPAPPPDMDFLADIQCPSDAESCAFACISAGFTAENFGPYTLLSSQYAEADCDCNEVFRPPLPPDAAAPDTPELHCTAVGPQLLRCKAIDLLFLGQSPANTSTARRSVASTHNTFFPRAVGKDAIKMTFAGGVFPRRGADDALHPSKTHRRTLLQTGSGSGSPVSGSPASGSPVSGSPMSGSPMSTGAGSGSNMFGPPSPTGSGSAVGSGMFGCTAAEDLARMANALDCFNSTSSTNDTPEQSCQALAACLPECACDSPSVLQVPLGQPSLSGCDLVDALCSPAAGSGSLMSAGPPPAGSGSAMGSSFFGGCTDPEDVAMMINVAECVFSVSTAGDNPQDSCPAIAACIPSCVCSDPAQLQALDMMGPGCYLEELVCSPVPTFTLGEWDVDVWPLGNDVVVDVGPGLCAYRFEVTAGSLFGVGPGGEFKGPPPPVSTRLAPVGKAAAGCPAEDCEYSCFVSGLGGINIPTKADADDGKGPTFVGLVAGCQCDYFEGVLSEDGTSYVADLWRLSADTATNTIKYTYQGAPGCTGSFQVVGPKFLGIPVDSKPTRNDTSSGVSAVTVEQAEAAAQALTVGVATAVGAAVGGAVAGAVGGAVGGATGGAVGGGAGGAGAGGAGGGGGGGGGAVTMVYQAQFLAVAGRVGGPDGQPESTQELSAGMSWANYHLISLHGDDAEDRRRRRFRRSDNLTWAEKIANVTTEEQACEAARGGDAELGATSLMAAISLTGAFFFREAIVRLLWWYRQSHGLERGDPAMPFPSWEVQIFLTQFQGLSEASGDAIASGCRSYEIGGGFMIFLLSTTLFGTLVLCWYGIKTRRAKWVHISFSEAYKKMKEVIKESKNRRLIGRITAFKEGLEILIMRGEWEQDDHQHRSDIVHTRFTDRYGSMFDAHHGKSWWYGFWNMFRSLMIGVVLSGITHARSNAGAVLGIGTLDTIILLIFNPDGDWVEWAKNVYRALMNIATVGSVLAQIDEIMDEDVFSNVFLLISIISMVPMIVSSLLGPVIAVFEKATSCLGMVGGGGSGSMAAAAAIGGVAAMGVDTGDVLDDIEATREEAHIDKRKSQQSQVEEDVARLQAMQEEAAAAGVQTPPVTASEPSAAALTNPAMSTEIVHKPEGPSPAAALAHGLVMEPGSQPGPLPMMQGVSSDTPAITAASLVNAGPPRQPGGGGQAAYGV